MLLLLPALLQGDTYRWIKEIGNAMAHRVVTVTVVCRRDV